MVVGGKLGFSVRVPKYRRSLHRSKEVAVTVETLAWLGGALRVLTSQPSQVSFKAAKSRRGARVTFQRLGEEEALYRDLQEVLEVLSQAGVEAESVSGEVALPAISEQGAWEDLLTSVPCSPSPLPLLSEAEMRALVEDLQEDLQEDLDTLEILGGESRRRTSCVAALIKRGDMIEYRVGQGEAHHWFRVLVTGKGKATGKNRNYLNLRYADGSEGGVYIDQHQWRFGDTSGSLALQENRENSNVGGNAEDMEEEVICRAGGGAARGRKRASVEMGGLEDCLSSMTIDLGGEGRGGQITTIRL